MAEQYYVNFISDETSEFVIKSIEWGKRVGDAHGQIYFQSKGDAQAFVVGYMARRIARLKRQLDAAEKAMNSATNSATYDIR